MFLLTALSLLGLRVEVSPFYRYVSDYANGPYGALFTGALLIHGTANLGIAAGMNATIQGSPWARRGIVLFGIASVGLIIGGLFPTDPLGTARTFQGNLHSAAAASGFVTEFLALLCLARGFIAEPAWRSHVDITMRLAALAAVGLAWLPVAVILDRGFPGLAERAVLGTFLAWEIATAIRLARSSARASPAGRRAREIDSSFTPSS